MPLDVAAQAGDDDDDMSAMLGAELDRQEGVVREPEPEPEPDEPEETAAEAAERARDELGRFAKTPVETPAKPGAQPAQAAAPVAAPNTGVAGQSAPVVAAEPVAADAPLRAPPSWSPTAKAAFANLPEEVKRAVAAREALVEAGFQKYRELKPIEKYADMARQSGTTLDRALENYVGIETALRNDFLGGISKLCERQGIDPRALANAILARSGLSVTGEGETPTALQQGQGSASARQTATADLTPIMQKIASLENYIQQQQSTGVQSEIERFGSDPNHPYFENVKADMGRLIKSGVSETLADAYEKACWNNAEIRALLIKQQSAPSVPSVKKVAAATQARAASRSITGSPAAGGRQKETETSIEDEVRAAFEAQLV